MLQSSYDELQTEFKIIVSGDMSVLLILQKLTETELAIVETDLCNLSISPELVLQYAITQQRYVCLKDLREFFRTLQEKQLAIE